MRRAQDLLVIISCQLVLEKTNFVQANLNLEQPAVLGYPHP